MKRKLIAVAILGAIAATTQAQAQTPSMQDLQQALVQAQKAAADAQKAAQQAQEALMQIQQAAAAAKSSQAASSSAGVSQPAGNGLVYKSTGDMVRLYGLIDLSGSNKSNANKAGNSLSDMSVAWFSGNRWGIEGEHALKDTDGLKAIFRLESEYELPTGNMDSPGILFNRDAWLGLESASLGKLTFGRQNTLSREFSKTYGDPYGSAKMNLEEGGWTNNNNFKQMIFYAASPTSTRYDRGIVWKKDFGGIVAGAAYQAGGVAGDAGLGSSKAVGLAYNGGAFNVSGFYNTANVANFTDTSYSLGGNYTVGMVRLNAGYFRYKADQPVKFGNRSDNAYTVSAKITPAGKFDYELGWQTMNAKNAWMNGSGFVPNAFANNSTSSAIATATGKRKTWYGSAFYHFDTRTELYLAADRLNTDGTYKAAQANGFMSQNEYAVGMRFKF